VVIRALERSGGDLIIGVRLDSSQLRIIRALEQSGSALITPNSVAAGRYKLNSANALNFDKKMTFKKNCAASGQLEFFVISFFKQLYLSYLSFLSIFKPNISSDTASQVGVCSCISDDPQIYASSGFLQSSHSYS